MIFFQTFGHSVVDFFSARKQGVGQDGVQPQGLEADASADRRRRRQGTNAIKLFLLSNGRSGPYLIKHCYFLTVGGKQPI